MSRSADPAMLTLAAPAEETAALALTIHATAFVYGEHGILLRGASGAGKSSLTLALIAAARSTGRFAELVADDRVRLTAASGRLIARPHPLIAGQIELRGEGILSRSFEPVARIVGLIDLAEDAPRLPHADERTIEIIGVALYHYQLETRNLSVARLTLAVEGIVRRQPPDRPACPVLR